MARVSKALILAVVLLVLFAGGTLSYASSEPTTKAKIAATPTALLLWLANSLGYLDDLPVQLINYPSGVQTGKALVDGKVQLATSSEFAYISRALQHPNLRLIATLSSSQSAKLIANRERVGMQPVGLRGKTIAVTKNSIGHFFLWQYLVLHGMSFGDVNLKFLAPDGIVAAMQKGDVDAALTWQPFAARISAALGARAVSFADQLDQFYYFSLYSTEAWLKGNEQLATDILKAALKAETFAHNHPDQAILALANSLKIRPEIMGDIWKEHALRIRLPLDLPSIMELAGEWRIEQSLSEKKSLPNVLTLIDLSPLTRASRSAVQITK
jgi:ABC-type nitrate/sulfonate/bicarbonate transport system substrate-binding protein